MSMLKIAFLLIVYTINVVAYETKYIGEMKQFWRNQPVIGRWLIGGMQLYKVPNYLSKTSFPYQKRPYPREVLFSDHLTVVRLLGGWDPSNNNGELKSSKEADLVYRGDDGIIHYRWELLGPRLDKYIEMGYTNLTIVLDNTPWAFPANPHKGTFGQVAPPGDMREWGAFVEELCHELVKRYGFETVNQWRFRQGTECSGLNRFYGSQEQYVAQYETTAIAVKKVLPGAKVGLFNQAGGKHNPEKNNVNYLEIVKHMIVGKNISNGKMKIPIDFIAISSYYQPPKKTNKNTAKAGYRRLAKTNNNFVKNTQSLFSKSRYVPYEVHEFGILSQSKEVKRMISDVRRTAIKFDIIFSMLAGGMDRLWHWPVVASIKNDKNKLILNGEGWLYSILEYTVGGEIYSLSATALQANTIMAVAVKAKGKNYIFISVVAKDESNQEPIDIDISGLNEIGLSKTTDMQWVYLTKETSVYSRIRNDLAKERMLQIPFDKHEDITANVNKMASPEGVKYISVNWEKYEKIMSDSLVLKRFNGTYSSKVKNGEIRFKAHSSGVYVIVF